jgi:hypothetical protein
MRGVRCARTLATYTRTRVHTCTRHHHTLKTHTRTRTHTHGVPQAGRYLSVGRVERTQGLQRLADLAAAANSRWGCAAALLCCCAAALLRWWCGRAGGRAGVAVARDVVWADVGRPSLRWRPPPPPKNQNTHTHTHTQHAHALRTFSNPPRFRRRAAAASSAAAALSEGAAALAALGRQQDAFYAQVAALSRFWKVRRAARVEGVRARGASCTCVCVCVCVCVCSNNRVCRARRQRGSRAWCIARTCARAQSHTPRRRASTRQHTQRRHQQVRQEPAGSPYAYSINLDLACPATTAATQQQQQQAQAQQAQAAAAAGAGGAARGAVGVVCVLKDASGMLRVQVPAAAATGPPTLTHKAAQGVRAHVCLCACLCVGAVCVRVCVLVRVRVRVRVRVSRGSMVPLAACAVQRLASPPSSAGQHHNLPPPLPRRLPPTITTTASQSHPWCTPAPQLSTACCCSSCASMRGTWC